MSEPQQHVENIIDTSVIEGHSCAACGIPFGVSKSFIDRRRIDGREFYCPNGHSLSFHTTELDRVKKELENEKRSHQWTRESKERVEGDRRVAYHRLAATKGVITKLKNRVSHGVCPCCSRTFKQLAAHMANKHPDYVDREPANGEAP